MASTPEQMRSREEFWEHHIDQMRESNQSHKVYCEANDLNLNTMRCWTRILGRTNQIKQLRHENKESYWRDIHKRHLASGLTAQEFCRKESIPPSSYRFWLRRFSSEKLESSPEVIFSPEIVEPLTFAPLELSDVASYSHDELENAYEIVIGDRVLKVGHGFDIDEVEKLVAMLSC